MMNDNLNEVLTVEAEVEGGVVEAEVVVAAEVEVVNGMHGIEVEEVGLRVENDLLVLLQDGKMIDQNGPGQQHV